MRRSMLASAGLAILIAGVLGGMRLAGAVGGPPATVPAAKLAAQATQTASVATAIAGPHAQKHPSVVLTVSPCPIDPSAFTIGVGGVIHPVPSLPLFAGKTFISEATTISSDGSPYSLFSGSMNDEPQQGVIVAARGEHDPCTAGHANDTPIVYLLPFKSGAVTLTKLQGDAVTYTTAGGASGSLNYTTGQLQ